VDWAPRLGHLRQRALRTGVCRVAVPWPLRRLGGRHPHRHPSEPPQAVPVQAGYQDDALPSQGHPSVPEGDAITPHPPHQLRRERRPTGGVSVSVRAPKKATFLDACGSASALVLPKQRLVALCLERRADTTQHLTLVALAVSPAVRGLARCPAPGPVPLGSGVPGSAGWPRAHVPAPHSPVPIYPCPDGRPQGQIFQREPAWGWGCRLEAEEGVPIASSCERTSRRCRTERAAPRRRFRTTSCWPGSWLRRSRRSGWRVAEEGRSAPAPAQPGRLRGRLPAPGRIPTSPRRPCRHGPDLDGRALVRPGAPSPAGDVGRRSGALRGSNAPRRQASALSRRRDAAGWLSCARCRDAASPQDSRDRADETSRRQGDDTPVSRPPSSPFHVSPIMPVGRCFAGGCRTAPGPRPCVYAVLGGGRSVRCRTGVGPPPDFDARSAAAGARRGRSRAGQGRRPRCPRGRSRGHQRHRQPYRLFGWSVVTRG
jgi:hypothetical protein